MITKAIELLKKSKNIAVFTHINSDGDALGSSIALKLGLEQLGCKVDLYCDDKIHENYYFLGIEKHYIEHEYKNYDLAIATDCPEVKRIGKYGQLFCSINRKIVIDHHLGNDIRCDARLVDVDAGSAGVLVYRLFKKLGIKLTKEMATAFYTSIASDTGCFIHANTTPEIHRIAADVMEQDIDIVEANFYLFRRKTKRQLSLFSKVVGNIEFHEDNQIAIAIIEEKDFIAAKATYVDTIGLPDYISGIDGISLAIVVTQTSEHCFLASFRSNKVNTSAIANEFGGGGHANASGCRICGKRENIVNKLLEACKREL